MRGAVCSGSRECSTAPISLEAAVAFQPSSGLCVVDATEASAGDGAGVRLGFWATLTTRGGLVPCASAQGSIRGVSGSGGGRKRVQRARGAVTAPALMLWDAAAAGLDLVGREDLVERLGALAADVEAPALVLVTHHVEEIPPSFTDVLLMREGHIVAAGPVEITLTADKLSETFGLRLVVARHGDRWFARAAPKRDPGTSEAPPTSS